MKCDKTRTGHSWGRATVVLILFAGLVLSMGCASADKKAAKASAGNLNLGKKPMCLISLRTENQYKPGWPPEVYRLLLFSEASKKKFQVKVIPGSVISKAFKDAFTVNKEGPEENLVRIQLPPGSYRLWAVAGGCAQGVGVAAVVGTFEFPFDIPFQVEGGECVYLGRIEMVNRQRLSEDEIPSGGKLPVIDQSVSGFGDGTFDVKIYDNYDVDIPRFRDKYPAFAGIEINKRILSPWTKPAR